MDESLDDGAVRELEEETGLKDIQLRQFHAFGDPGRDPRGRTITIAYWGMVTEEKARLATAGDDAKSLDWFPIDSLPALAFDHSDVISVAIEAAGKEGALS